MCTQPPHLYLDLEITMDLDKTRRSVPFLAILMGLKRTLVTCEGFKEGELCNVMKSCKFLVNLTFVFILGRRILHVDSRTD